MAKESPFWMTAKRDGQCAECEGVIQAGERIVYSPEDFKAYCKQGGCGEEIFGLDPKDEL